MVSYGYKYGGGLLAGALVAGALLGWPYALPFVILAVFCLNFFRDPERDIPAGPVAVSPADGKVVAIRPVASGANRISIFLNIFDVHVNRTPIAGKVTCVSYKRGQFLAANKDEASEVNEQNVMTVAGVVGGVHTSVMFKQIAGLIARRIVCYKKSGDVLEPGERIGLMKFGSRVDVFLGPEWNIAVHAGERVRAGSSILARIRESAPREAV